MKFASISFLFKPLERKGCVLIIEIIYFGFRFSKSISSYMPTVTELAEYIKSKINLIPGDYEVYKSLVDDPENLLSYLYQPMPWKKMKKV